MKDVVQDGEGPIFGYGSERVERHSTRVHIVKTFSSLQVLIDCNYNFIRDQLLKGVGVDRKSYSILRKQKKKIKCSIPVLPHRVKVLSSSLISYVFLN